jgi:methionyl-tRNA formyltransferase
MGFCAQGIYSQFGLFLCMLPKTVVFLGSKPIGYECLEWLISQKPILNLDILGIMTKPRKEFGDGHNLEELAQKNGIPIFSSLDSLPECDIIYSVQYHEILKREHIDKAKQIAVNLHMAPLPEYRGSNQFSFAIMEEKAEFGTTVHCMDTGVDNGDILFQKRFPIPENCWVEDLYELTYNASVNLFRQTLGHIVLGKYSRLPQDLLESKYGTSMHYRAEMDYLKQIDLRWDKHKIEKHIRATSMPGFEPPYCIIGGQKVYFSLKK